MRLETWRRGVAPWRLAPPDDILGPPTREEPADTRLGLLLLLLACLLLLLVALVVLVVLLMFVSLRRAGSPSAGSTSPWPS